MRTENEMYNLILEIAENDARIKAVYMKTLMQRWLLQYIRCLFWKNR